jgi:thiol:disulfide interchange protein DsbA
LTILLSAACSENEAPAPAAAPETPDPTATAVAATEPATEQPATSPPAASQPTVAEPAPPTAVPSAESSPPPIEPAQVDSATDALAAAGYQSGVHYQRLAPTQPTSSGPDQVEVAEFFMYSCVHCYNFEPYVQEWLTRKPDYVNFIRVPTVWNSLARLHGQAFFAAEALGKGAEVHTPFFREVHVSGNLLESEAALAAFFSRFGVDEAAFKGALASFSVHTNVQRADELTRRYRITGTPSVVVNGKYVTMASMAGGYEQLMKLVDALAASERAPN